MTRRFQVLILSVACLFAGGMTSMRSLGSRVASAGALVAAGSGSGSGAVAAPVAPTPPTPPAAQVVVTPAPAPSSGLDIVAILATIGVVLGGVALLLAGLSVILHAVAKATHSTVLETAAVDVDHVRATVVDVLDELGIASPNAVTVAAGPMTTRSTSTRGPANVTIVNQAAPADTVNVAPQTPPLAPSKAPQAGHVRIAMLVVLAIVGSIGLSSLASCSTSKRQDTIHAALVTTDAARDGFLAYDKAREHAIVESATSFANGEAKLVEYRATRDKVAAAFAGAYHALVVAALSDDGVSLSNAQAIVGQLVDAVQSFLVVGGK